VLTLVKSIAVNEVFIMGNFSCTDAEIARLFSVQNEVLDKVRSGQLSVNEAFTRERDILSGTYPVKPNCYPPCWWESIDSQIKALVKLRQKAGLSIDDIPQPPSNFEPITPSEVLLLDSGSLPNQGEKEDIQTVFDYWWNSIPAEGRIKKIRAPEVKSGREYLHIIPGIDDDKPPRWVGFDPESYIGLSSLQAINHARDDGAKLAYREVMIAATLFPKWLRCWDGKKWHYPNMSGYNISYNDNNLFWRSPRLAFSIDGDGHGPSLTLSAYEAIATDCKQASPTIRELEY
jgi:hypothetical protein